MGYQESLLIAKTKEDFIKLCNTLTAGKPVLDDFIQVNAIGKLNNKLLTLNPYNGKTIGILPAGTYFVWIGGERHPFQSGSNMSDDEKKTFLPNTSSWEIYFAESVAMKDLLQGFVFSDNNIGICQKNNVASIVYPAKDRIIKVEYINQIE